MVVLAGLGVSAAASRAASADAVHPDGTGGPAAGWSFVANLRLSRATTIAVSRITAEGIAKPELLRDVPACSVATEWGGLHGEHGSGSAVRRQGADSPSGGALPDGLVAIGQGGAPVGAVARTGWPETGGAVLSHAVVPSKELIVPLVLKRLYGQTSQLTVLNADQGAGAEVELSLFWVGDTRPVTELSLTIEPGMHVTLDLDKSTPLSGVPDGFVGWMRATANVEIAVATIVDIESSDRAVYDVLGVLPESASTKLFVPQFRRQHGGTSFFSVVNPGGDANPGEAEVKVTFTGLLGDCRGRTYTQRATVAAGTSAMFYQGAGQLPVTGESPLPPYCAGTAIIEATGGRVLAVVNDTSGTWPPATSAAYHALGIEQAATRVLVPLFRKSHTALNFNTSIFAFNLGTRDASAVIAFRDSTGAEIPGCAGQCIKTIPLDGFFTWVPNIVNAIPDDSYGSAVVTSDQPIMVIVTETSPWQPPAFDYAIYNALPCSDSGPSRVVIPFAPHESQDPTATPEPPDEQRVYLPLAWNVLLP